MQNALQWIEVDGRALRNNLALFHSFAGNAQLIPVLKANAYGHGILETARALRDSRTWGYAVAGSEEALFLQQNHVRNHLLILSFWTEQELLALPNLRRVAVSLFEKNQITVLAKIAQRKKIVLRVHLKVDTGTSRIGFLPQDVPATLRQLQKNKYLRLEGIFSHFAEAENDNQQFSKHQRAMLDSVLQKNLTLFPNNIMRHIACSAAISRGQGTQYELARLGIGLYGYWPSQSAQRSVTTKLGTKKLQKALSWKAKIIQIKTVPAGTTIGYGRTFRATQKLRYGVLPVGYADGYDRRLSNVSTVLVHGKVCHVLGRICMNLMMIDLTTVSIAKTGDTATLLGTDRGQTIDATALGKLAGTIDYEILSRLRPTLPHILLHG